MTGWVQPEDRWAGLMRDAQGGDRVAYTRLLEEITPVIRRLAVKRWGDFEHVEDLVQDVLLSIHSVRHTYDPNRPFLPWMVVIVRNRMADAARRYSRQAGREMDIDACPETFLTVEANASYDGPGDPQELLRAIEQLPEGQRQAVEMLKLKEMSLKEASAATGVSVAALKVATHRALKALRVALGGGVPE